MTAAALGSYDAAMVGVVAVLAFVVAVTAGVYSTWSPCGLSMMSQLTPVAERGRGHRFWVTASWFVFGALVGGATLGLGVALLAVAVHAVGLSTATASAIAALCALGGAAIDARLLPFAPPFLRRQVDENWLTSYRGWVYGFGFGWQIGAGVTTYIMTSAVFVLIAFAGLSASPLVAFAAAMTFATVRGLAVFSTARVTTGESLRAFHRRVDVSGPYVRTAVACVLALVAVVAATATWGVVGLLIGSALVVVGTIVALPRRRVAQSSIEGLVDR